MQIETILSQIDLGSYALPVFQRGYVWNRDQVRKMMTSLYRDYPIGSLLIWVTQTDQTLARGEHELSSGTVNLILDGQQRITTLYGIIRGEAPPFFEGDSRAFTNLYFNLEEETFEFYLPMKMKGNPKWVDVSELMKLGAGKYVQDKMADGPEYQFLVNHFDQLNRIDNIKRLELPIQQVSGTDKTIDVVVDIFNNVNSGGTKLSKGDLALAKVCAQWPEAREALNAILEKYEKAGYRFEMDWLLRCVTVYLTKQPYFSPLGDVAIADFKNAVPKTNQMIGEILDRIASRLGLNSRRVLGSRFSIPVIIGILQHEGGKMASNSDWDKLLYWYIHTFLWGRYAGSTESVMAQDLNIVATGEGVDGLIRQLRQNRGNLEVLPDDFRSWSTGARLYPLLYMLTRVNHARDFETGVELSNTLLGHNSSLEVHHIFPKALLYKKGYNKAQVNALANYCFLTKQTNLAISNKAPGEYMPIYMKQTPGALESNWIPTHDPALFELKNYELFLENRRILLANAANQFLESLLSGRMYGPAVPYLSQKEAVQPLIDDKNEFSPLLSFVTEYDLPSPDENYALLGSQGEVIALFDLAWPEGIQEGLSEAVALVLEGDSVAEKAANKFGYRYFTSVDELLAYLYSVTDSAQFYSSKSADK